MRNLRFFALIVVLHAVTPAYAQETITLRSGNGTVGSTDSNITFYSPGDGAIGPFSTANFDAARNGPKASIHAADESWVIPLPADPAAQWITVDASKSPQSALYAYNFTVKAKVIKSASLDLYFAVDNELGDPSNPGLYLNGTAIAGTTYLGGFRQQYYFHSNDIGPLLHPGVNTFYFYQYDSGVVAGSIFNATFSIATTPFDFDGDGQADLLWQNQATGGVYAWLMNGVTYTGSGGYINPPNVVSTDWKVAGAADFNADGTQDLVWQNSVTGGVYVWYLQGLQYSGQGGYIITAIDPNWKVVGTPDLNGDGHPDILWQNSATGAVYYWLMNGLQYTGQGGYIAPPGFILPDWKVVATPDFNNDGKPDILWQNTATGEVYVWYMNGVSYSGNGDFVIASIDPHWHVVGVPDLNGDGKPDLLWQNSATGGVYYWLMNGATYIGPQGYIIPSIDPSWQIAGIH